MTTNNTSKQSRLLTIAAMMLCAILVSNHAYAYGNDFLEKQDNYRAYANGQNRVHFQFPVYSRGTNDYYVGTESSDSYAYYMLKGSSSKVKVFYYGGQQDKNGPSADDDYSYGRAYIRAANVGVIEVTNTTSGQRRVITPGSWVLLDVKKKKETTNDDDYVTWLEVDWYPYEALEDTTFRVGTAVDIRRRYTGNTNYSKDWILEEGLRGVNNTIKPQLYDPYFYAVNETGNAGYGYAAVPYMVFDEPISYTTSLSSKSLITTDRAGTIFVPTTDTIQEGFYATFTTWYDKAHGVKRAPQQTTKVNIPAYHRIYDFFVKEEKDELETFTGNNVLTWSVKNPHLPDLVSGDFFEIQRALKSDFSDARTIDIVAMQRGLDKSTYTYVDKSRESWTGNNTNVQYTDTLRHDYWTRLNYTLYDANGKPMCELKFSASAKTAFLPAVPVYYRIRRASSSVWGWKGHEFVCDTICMKHNFLAPLAEEQPAYTLDAESRKVDMHIRLKNADVAAISIPTEEVELYNINVLSHNPESDTVLIGIKCVRALSGWARAILRDETDTEILQQFDITPGESSLHKMPKNSVLQILGGRGSSATTSMKYTLDHDLTVLVENYTNGMINFPRSCVYNNIYEDMAQALTQDEQARLNEVMPQLKQEIGVRMAQDLNDNIGKCMWDRSANLVLIKTIDSVKQELIIPQDSIRRLENGDWEAHFVDLANQACTDYSYAVRIDQSNSDLHVSDSAFLIPKVLTGPNLYFEEGASIKEFNATQGDTNSDRKRGVYLNWQPSTMAVDEYILTRVKENSSEVADTLYTGLENSFFDITAQPLQRYEYTITAVYDCNGKHSDHTKSVIGWRTKYGEISGQVFMPDNSGMAGVNVALQGPDGQTMRTTMTDANGAYRFDSIEYPIPAGGNYVVVPTHAYGTFSFNNTSATTASITLNADNAIAYGIYFYNTSTVRLSGRALYKNSTIPVAGAMFVLNNDTVRRNRAPLTTAIDGTFELTVTKGQLNKLQIFKPGHTFEGDGILRVEDGSETFALDESLDGVRFYDETKVRLIGRVAGGNDQRDLPHGFGLGKNNLGDDLQLVLQLEGDNTAHFVHDPNDLTRDTIHQSIDSTETLFEKKRVTIRPDQKTGEYAVDLFPVKYKVVQASAHGYATLLAAGQGSETFDLTEAPLKDLTETYEGDTIHYQALYDRIYHTPVQIQLTQLLYGLEQDGFGEKTMKAGSFAPNAAEEVQLYTKGKDGTVTYTLGHPLFYHNRRYQFQAFAFEDYYYNNNPKAGSLDRVPQRSGQVTIHNGMHSTTEQTTYTLDKNGKNSTIWLPVDRIETEIAGEGALRTVSAALTIEGNTVETDVFRAFVTGDIVLEKELHATDADINLLDIIRDPGGNGSYAWVESGTTYNYSYTESYDWNFGVSLYPKYGVDVTSDIGTVTAPEGAGTYVGSCFESKKQFSLEIPITHEWSWGYKYNYSYTTNDKISTSSKASRDGIGSNADVFLGTTISQLCGKAKSVAVINDSLYQARQPAILSGAMKVLSNGVDTSGKAYHLVVGEKVVLGSEIGNTFAYSQHYILKAIMPQIILQQMDLLMYFPNEQAAQAAADAAGEPVYWYFDSTQISMRDSIDKKNYRMILPTGTTKVYADKVAALNNMFRRWASLLINNEREKTIARMTGMGVGTYSVSYGNSYTHTESYSAMANYNELPQGGGLVGAEAEEAAAKIGESVLSNGKELMKFFNTKDAGKFASLVVDALSGVGRDLQKNMLELAVQSNTSKWSMSYAPVLSFETDSRTSDEVTRRKSSGFTISPDNQGDITVSVYRAPADSLWKDLTKDIRDNVNHGNEDEILYGSYVFFTEAGSTFCIHEEEEKTQFYNPGMVLGNATMALAVPEISIDNYEKTNIPADQRARFRIELRNAGQVQSGAASSGTSFSLALDPESNPNGAKVYLSGAALINPITFLLRPGQTISQILEVERGETDDYDSLRLFFYVDDCMKYNNTSLDLGVHFMPVSCEVNIASPRQNWIMNTLSQRDSTGYYLPIEIDGFDIWHKNFDHIEFQYKLSTESEDMWVNQCSFYADDSLYNLASGSKEKIVNGRIPPFRFYGERDPMEQQYDLRAVSFCRYGSGFVHKASPIISGTKDTRPPRVFGSPQPADAILGVGNDFMLRFNEAIAGNYLDEDNNFQIMGMTNATGITTGTSLHFNEAESSNASTKVSRSLTNSSFTLDMLVRPSAATGGSLFKTLSTAEDYAVSFDYTADGRLRLMLANNTQAGIFATEPGALPAGIFSRVVAVYDNDQKTVRFFIGTQQIALSTDQDTSLPEDFVLEGSGPFRFGIDGASDMLEARVWLKALTQEEIAATNMKYLTGYERDLLAYYRMNEGHGETIKDRANGATLYLNETAWNLKKGISLDIKSGERAVLNGNLLSRSAIQDESILLWFKTASQNGTIFSVGRVENDSVSAGTKISLESGVLMLHNDSAKWRIGAGYANNEWHHLVLTVDRTRNNISVFVDSEMKQSFSATNLSALAGAMYLGGNGFAGNIDDLVFFEQALPKYLIQEFDNGSPSGDEMGIFGYLPFEQQILNPNGVLELVFSPNDRRVIRDPYGNVVNKVITLITSVEGAASAEAMADKINHAPTRDQGLLTKMKFDWAFNNDELLINLNMADREINKQTIYVTVRDVEDLNGNPMVSPVSWVAFVDRNALKWSEKTLRVVDNYDDSEALKTTIDIINESGRRHQYTIESIPDWLTINKTYGSLNAEEEKRLTLTFDPEMPVGVYNDHIYLIDEDGLAEPLIIEFTVKANPPYEEIDNNKYPLNMSICGHVMISKSGGMTYDTDEQDIVYAFCSHQLVGSTHVSINDQSNKAELFLTVNGNKVMTDKPVTFQLWRASTGKTYSLYCPRDIKFAQGAVEGCGDATPLYLTTTGTETMSIPLKTGWSWISVNLDLTQTQGVLSKCINSSDPWTKGDIIKTPASQQMATYSEIRDRFDGDLDHLHHSLIYKVLTHNGNTMRIAGDQLAPDSMHITLRGDGKWNALPCLLNQTTTLSEAMADYYDHATAGDIIKAKKHFAYFSADKRWVGDLTALTPGEGYLFRRMGAGNVTVNFYDKSAKAAPKRVVAAKATNTGSEFTNPSAATNMTMIAKLNSEAINAQGNKREAIKVYVGDELAAIAEPIDSLYFITIQSDKSGALRFETEDGTLLTAEQPISYVADTHAGSLKAPIFLKPTDHRPYKIIENNHVIIIRNNEKYSIDGKKL